MKKALFLFLQASLCNVSFLGVSSHTTQAQVTTDGTVNTQVSNNGNVAEITGGETRGSNLFHSFQDFSIGTGNEAFFDNSDSISNIFSRVTGGNISNIDGLIRANGSASLFLINPAGILFGQNARLDIGGSFYGSTASSILFEDGEFSAADLENPPLLTVNAPIGLGFRDNPGDIINHSRVDGLGLEVAPGLDIALLGGNINLEGGLITSPEGTITLGGLNSSGEISISETNIFSFPEEIAQSNVSLTEQAEVNVQGEVGGSIQVNANNLEIEEASSFLAGIPINSGSENVQSGDINLNLNNLIASEESEIRNETFGIGNAGNINIITGNLEFTEGAAIIASTFGQGNAGDVNINATGDVSFDRDFGGIYSTVGIKKDEREPNIANVVGNAGNITIFADSFSLTNGGRLSTKTAGVGDAGNVAVNTTDRVFIDGKGNIPIEKGDFTFNIATAILTQVEVENEEGTTFTGQGNAGNIEIKTTDLIVKSATEQSFGPQINTDNRGGIGNSGSIFINASDLVLLEGTSQLNSQLASNAIGNAGNINIFTGNLNLFGGLILSDSSGTGNAGNIEINISDQLTINDESLISSGLGMGGIGHAGDITINVANQFLINDQSIVTSAAEPNAVGNAGDIEIYTGSQIITDSIIIADSQAQGSGGNINITAEGNIILQSTSNGISSRIVTGLDRSVNNETGVVESVGEGNAGNIDLSANQITIDDRGFIISDIEGIATGGGEISIDVDILRIENNSFISTFTITESNAGSINVSSDILTLISGGKLITSTDGDGDAGTINLNIGDQIVIDNGVPPSVPRIEFEDPVLDELQNRTGLFVNATDRATGNGGDIFIQNRFGSPTNKLRILNSAEVSADGGLRGNAGNIFILSEYVELDNNVSLAAKTFSETGGNINLTVNENLTLNNNSSISTEANSFGNGGNINIDTKFLIAFPKGNNDIIASAEQGQGGSITINAESLFGIRERPLNPQTNDINASSEFSLDGSVTINTPDINPAQGATELPIDVIVPEETSQQACEANREIAAKNVLNITGRGGIVPEPGLPLDSLNVTVNGQTNPNPTSTIPQPIETSQGKIQPARGIKIKKDGGIVLTAYRTDNSGVRLPEKKNCG